MARRSERSDRAGLRAVGQPEHYDSDLRTDAVHSIARRLLAARGLIGLLVLRDLTVRYKRSLLGVWWTLFNPLLTTGVMWVVFSAVFRFEIPGNVPFVVYLLSGVLVVTFFSQGLLAAGSSVRAAAPILTKVAVTPEVFPVAAVAGAFVNLLIGVVILLLLQLGTGIGIAFTAPLAIVPVVLLAAFTFGLGLLVATVAVRYEDVIPTVTVLLSVLVYATPTFYPLSIIPDSYRVFIELNPLLYYLVTFRGAMYEGDLGTASAWLVMLLCSGSVLALGLWVFNRTWRTSAVLL